MGKLWDYLESGGILRGGAWVRSPWQISTQNEAKVTGGPRARHSCEMSFLPGIPTCSPLGPITLVVLLLMRLNLSFLDHAASLWPLKALLLPSQAIFSPDPAQTIPLGCRLSSWYLTSRTGAIGKRWAGYLYQSLRLHVSEMNSHFY